MLLVTGGYVGWDGGLMVDTTETFDPSVGSWASSDAKLLEPLAGLRAVSINNRVLIFGNNIN